MNKKYKTTVRLSENSKISLEKLVLRLECSQSQVIRMAILMLEKQVGEEPPNVILEPAKE